MSAPPWVFACIMSLINAWHADKTGEKVSELSPSTKKSSTNAPDYSSGTLSGPSVSAWSALSLACRRSTLLPDTSPYFSRPVRTPASSSSTRGSRPRFLARRPSEPSPLRSSTPSPSSETLPDRTSGTSAKTATESRMVSFLPVSSPVTEAKTLVPCSMICKC